MPAFEDPQVAASTPAMSVFEPKNLLERMQNAEYIFGIAARHALSAVNGIYVTPGPFSVYRRSRHREVGGFRHAHQAEDMEMALRLQRAGYEIENAPRARVYTKVPKSVPKLIKQRTRWTPGFLRNVMTDYRDLVGNPRYGVLGLLVLPLGFVAIVGGVGAFPARALHAWAANPAYLLRHRWHSALTYTLTPHFSSEWLYAPVTFVTIISFVALVISSTFVSSASSVSKTKANLTMSILGYALLYGFIAPFWLMRALADVATGTRRSWR
jgi:cellulose synthase/poly-beta-1,6-N-acetylglucosamine synthase-like glycosyltransferase